MAFLFTINDTTQGQTTVYSVHCSEENHEVHCEGGIYNLVNENGIYVFTDNDIPQWLKDRQSEINDKIRDYYRDNDAD